MFSSAGRSTGYAFGMLKIHCVLALAALSHNQAHADENVQAAWKLLSEGYRAMAHVQTRADALPAAHASPWPVAFQDAQHSIGNSMAEFQPFGRPYFHGGCDLRTKAGEDIHAVVSGHLEAGHYGYDTNEDGSLTKY